MMHQAGWLRAYLANLALVDAFGDDGFGGELARLEFRPGRLFFAGGLVGTNFDVPVAGQCRAAFLLLPIGRADLYEFGLGGKSLGDMGIDLPLIADGVGALCGIWANCKSFPLVPRRRAICEATRRPGEGWIRESGILCGFPFWTLARSLHRECPLPIDGVQNRSEWTLNMPEALHYFRSLDWEHLIKELRMFRRENLLGGLP
jgi:hypothetical protein